MAHSKNEEDIQPVALTPQARAHYEQSFLPRYRALAEEIDRVSLVVLVWGPGPNGSHLYAKRLQIRDELRMRGHAALFSEEVDTSVSLPDLSLKARELLQARIADFIIVLQASCGATAEVHDFADYHSLASKMLIFLSEHLAGGYSDQGVLAEMKCRYNNVETFKDPDDVVECRLLGQVLRKVRTLQIAKFYREFV